MTDSSSFIGRTRTDIYEPFRTVAAIAEITTINSAISERANIIFANLRGTCITVDILKYGDVDLIF